MPKKSTKIISPLKISKNPLKILEQQNQFLIGPEKIKKKLKIQKKNQHLYFFGANFSYIPANNMVIPIKLLKVNKLNYLKWIK